MAGFPVQDGDIRVSWIWWVLSQTHHIDSCIWTIFSWKKPKNCLSHSHTSGRGEKPVEVGGRAGHRLTKTPHSDLDLEDIWRPAFSLGWKLQAALFFFAGGVTLTSPLPCCSLRLLPDRCHVSGFLGFAAGTQGIPLNLWLWGLNWWPHKTVYICVFSKLLPWGGQQTDFQQTDFQPPLGGAADWLPVCLNLRAA